MRILHTADWHLGKNLEGVSRLDEQEKFLDDFVQIVKDNNIDLVIIAGDIYDSSNPPARAEKLFYRTLKMISNDNRTATLVISGNHDNPDRLVAATPLAMEHGIIMVGTPKTIVPIGSYGCCNIIESGEGYIEVEINHEKAVIITVPYPSEKRLNEVIYKDMEEDEEKAVSYSDKIFSLFDALKNHFREDTINVVVSHLFTMGSEEGGSERSIQLGGTYIVDSSCFPREAQYIALGHVHKPQIVPGTNKRARYAGSPLQYNKKEINFIKKCYIVELKAKEEAIIEEVELKTYKPIDIWKCDSIEEAIDKCKKNADRDSYVYLEVKTDRYIRQEEIKEMKGYKDDILEITPIIEGVDVDYDYEEVSSKSFEELFVDFYKKERKLEPEQEVIDTLLSVMREE